MMTVAFKCGHELKEVDFPNAPVCPVCGERQIANVKAPAPKFRGAASGPLVVKG